MALNTIVAAAGVAVVGALCAYFLWPAAAGAAMMKAPGAPGRFISRRAFEGQPQALLPAAPPSRGRRSARRVRCVYASDMLGLRSCMALCLHLVISHVI
ncbi:hypothetical protein ACP4OV_028488 [Aristida adscensionis]